jgi:hypothetical protein
MNQDMSSLIQDDGRALSSSDLLTHPIVILQGVSGTGVSTLERILHQPLARLSESSKSLLPKRRLPA